MIRDRPPPATSLTDDIGRRQTIRGHQPSRGNPPSLYRRRDSRDK